MKFTLPKKAKPIILLIFPLLLCSCSSGTSSPSSAIEQNQASSPTLGITNESLLTAIDTDNTFNIERPYTYESYTVEWYRNKYSTIKTLTFIEPDNEEISAMSFVTEGANDTVLSTFLNYFTNAATLCGIDTTTLLDDLIICEKAKSALSEKGYNEITSRNLTCRYEIDKENNYYILKIFPTNTSLDIASLPTKVMREKDFFTSEENQALYSEYLDTHQYSEIIKMADNYIIAESPKATDSAYIIKEKIEPLIPSLENCVVIPDEFNGTASIYYKGLEEVSKTNNFITFINESTLVYRVGFINNDWLFFDDVEIKVDEEVSRLNCSSSARDVLDGGNILEYGDCYPDDSVLEKMLASNNISIRFEGENNKTLDHALSADEISAIKFFTELKKTYNYLSDLKYHWLNP